MDPVVILHMVTWYPSSEDDIDGVFTKRHIELLATDKRYKHVVVQRSKKAFSLIEQGKSLLGFFVKKKIGSLTIIQLPDETDLNRSFLWRFKEQLETKQLSSLIKAFKPSILHLHVVYGFAKEAMAIHQNWGIPFVVSEHMAPFPFEWIQDKQTYIQQPMQQAAAVVAVGKAQAKQIEDFTGIAPKVIPNVVNTDEFYYKEKSNNEASLQIVLVGIYDSRKGADYLLNTLPQFLQHHPSTTLHLVGDVSDERRVLLNDIIKKGSVQHAVCFHGKLSAAELCSLYHQCDFYVCSSEWESFGVSVLEALFAGVPVLATDCGGVLEFLNEQNSLIIRNDRKEDTLLNGMLSFTNNLKAFNRKYISESAIQNFSGDHIKEQYALLYQQVLSTTQTKKYS